MNCPYCGTQLKDEQPKFCSSCGKTITTAAPSTAAPSTAAPSTAAAPVAPHGAGILAPGQEEVFFVGRPAALRSLGGALLALLTLGIYWIVMALKMRGVSYRVTSQRIVVETGLFSKKLEQVDLYRVVDYVVERPFFQRIMGTGNLVVETLDKTQPEVRIDGVCTDVVALYERLRTATEAAKRARGVALIDMEHQ